jgi:solute carrier family 6 GABA transporter-like protein 1
MVVVWAVIHYMLGAFLIVYFIAMVFCGIPIFFQEVAMGQYLGSGGMTLVSQLCPMMKGKH